MMFLMMDGQGRNHGRCWRPGTTLQSRGPFGLATLCVMTSLAALLIQPVVGLSQAPATGKGQAAKSGAQTGQRPIRNDDDPRVKATVTRGVDYLKNKSRDVSQLGQLSLMAHALAKVREKYPDVVAPNDPVLQGMIDKIRSHCGNPFKPMMGAGHDNYEAGCVAMALAAAGGEAYKAELSNVAQFIITKQMSHGAWSYVGLGPGGDTSQTQYAILGLWEASASAGVPIPPEVWDKAAQWLVTTQKGDGGFAYHPKDPGGTTTRDKPSDTMTMASLGSLYICRDQLGGIRRNTRGLLVAVQDKEASGEFRPQTKLDALDKAIAGAAKWMASRFSLEKPRGETDNDGTRWVYYTLYALERYATLGNLTQVANVDWYAKGAEYLISRQQDNGSWNLERGGEEGAEIQTSFAVLFLVRSTVVSKKIHEKRLGRGTLVSGRNLPTNLIEMEQKGNQLRAKEIRGNAGKLLETIEGGKAADVEGALIGLRKDMYEKKWSAMGAEGERLRKLLENGFKKKDAEMIKRSLQLLALTGDYRVVPLLIDGMYYEDDAEVQLAARESLCLISRKFHGFGYAEEPTLEEWMEEIDKWKAWYRSVRPEAEFEDDVVEIK